MSGGRRPATSAALHAHACAYRAARAIHVDQTALVVVHIDVCTRPMGIGIARSCTKSEYAEPHVLAY